MSYSQMAAKFTILLAWILLAAPTCYGDGKLGNFEQFGIVPNVIDKTPTQKLQVKFPSGKEADFGNQLSKKDTKDTPAIDFEADDGSLYTLSMIDPDAPTPKNASLANFLHWLVVNIPGKEVSSGDVKSSYFGPAPPSHSRAHRYIFLIYEQQGGRIEGLQPYEKRTKFDMKKFAEDYNLGGPLAGNFFLTSTNSNSRA